MLKVKQSLLKQNETLQSELTTLKQRPGFEEHRSTTRHESLEKMDVGTECWIAAHSHDGTQTEPCNDIQDSDEVYAECRRNLEAEFQEKILKLITFEIPKDYFNFNNNNDIVPMGTIEALVKMCVECKWQRDTLERKVAELVKELRDAKCMYEECSKAANELDCECRMLKGNVEKLTAGLMVSKSGGGEGLAPIPENSEEAEAMEQKIVMLENEIEVLREARSNLEADAKGLREEGQALVKQLQTANAMLWNQENLETEVSRWQEAVTNADGQLKEALAAKCCLEEEVEKLRREVTNLEAINECQESSFQRTLEKLQEKIAQLQERLLDQEHLQSEREALMNTVTYTQDQLHLSNCDRSKLRDETEELQKQVQAVNTQEHLQAEVASLQQQLLETQQVKEQVTVKTRQLEDASQKISEYERHSQDLHDQLNNCKEDLDTLKANLNDKETQLSEILSAKLLMQKELCYVQEEFNQKLKEISKLKDEKMLIEQNLMHVVSDKTNAENRFEGLLSELHSKSVEIQNLKKVQLELEQELEKLHSARVETEYGVLRLQATAVEVDRWKEMAEASERQLNEALEERDKLEQECRRLYLIETQVRNQEHLDREVGQLKKLLEETEQNCAHLLADTLSLKEQCADMKNQLKDLRHVEKEAKEKAANAEQQLMDVLHDKAELETQCQMMHTIEEKFRTLEKDFIMKKELSISLQQELSDVTSAKCELEEECKRLLAVEEKLRNQEILELEVKEVRQKLEAVEQQLNEAVTAKLQLEDDYKKMETAYKLLKIEVTTQKMESRGPMECETLNSQEVLKAMEEQILSLQSEKQETLSLLDKKMHENDILKADNNRFLQMISGQKSDAARLEHMCQYQDNEAAQIAKETIENLSKIIMDKDMEIEALSRNSETLLHLHDAQSKNEEFIKFREAVSEQFGRLNSERAELIRTVQVKHQESVQYHNEIQRLTGVLDQEMKKLEEMKCQHANLTQQYEEKQKMMLSTQNDLAAAEMRIQELEKGQVKLAGWNVSVESDAVQRMSELVQRHAQELQAREDKIQLLQSQVTDLQNQLVLISQEKQTEPNPSAQSKVRHIGHRASLLLV